MTSTTASFSHKIPILSEKELLIERLYKEEQINFYQMLILLGVKESTSNPYSFTSASDAFFQGDSFNEFMFGPKEKAIIP